MSTIAAGGTHHAIARPFAAQSAPPVNSSANGTPTITASQRARADDTREVHAAIAGKPVALM